MEMEEMKFTELVNTELTRMFKVKNKHNWDNIKRKVYEINEGEVDADTGKNSKGPKKAIDG